MAELLIGTAATPQRWRRTLHAHVRDHVAGVRLVVLQDSAEVFSAGVDVVIVDDTMDFLTPTQALALRDQGVRVVGIYDPDGREGKGRGAIDGLGVDVALAVTTTPEVLLDKVARVVPSRAGREQGGVAAPPRPLPVTTGAGGPGAGSVAREQLPAVDGRPGRVPAVPGSGRGAVVAVAGGSDSPGRTETAVALAAALAMSGPTVLLDLDEHSPTVARRLGYHVAPNVLDVLGALHAGSTLAPALGQRASFAPGDVPFDVVCGLANPNDWAQLRDVTTLLGALAGTWQHVVVDTGPSCEPDQVPPGGARNAATRTAVRFADHVVAVTTPTPLGVLRLLDWASAAAELLDGKPVTVAVNRAPADRYAVDQLRTQLVSNLPSRMLGRMASLADDVRVTQAQWDAAVTRSGPFTGSVEDLAAQLVPGFARPVRRRLDVLRRWR